MRRIPTITLPTIKMLPVMLGLLLGLLWLLPPFNSVSAQTCYPSRVVNEYTCQGDYGNSCPNIQDIRGCQTAVQVCTISLTRCFDHSDCGAGQGSCGRYICSHFCESEDVCVATASLVSCNDTTGGNCNWTGNIRSCATQTAGTCIATSEPRTYGCWVNEGSGDDGGSGGEVPPTGGSCGGGSDCFPGLSNCGEVGRDPGSGSCSGGLCCQPKGTWSPGCDWNVDEMPYPSCKYGEGNACHPSCNNPPWTNGCSGCATGLVGGGCFCPSCSSLVVSPDTTTLTPGQTQNLSLTKTGTSDSWQVTSYNPGVATAVRIGNSLRVTGVSPGTANIKVSITGQKGGTIDLCSDLVSVLVTSPPVCTTPTISNASLTSCGRVENGSVITNGKITWTWPHGANTNQHSVIIYSLTGGVVVNTGWISNGTAAPSAGVEGLNCSGGTCAYVYSAPPSDTSYYAQVAARSSTNVCTPSDYSTPSSHVTMSACPHSLTGNVYLDDGTARWTGSQCVLDSGNYVGLIPGDGSQVSVLTSLNPVSSPLNPDGSYTITSIPGRVSNYAAQLELGDTTTYTCACPNPSCTHSLNVGPDKTLNFIVTSQRDAWFQVVGGDIHADNRDPLNQVITNPLPFTCAHAPAGECTPYLITRTNPSTPYTAGTASYAAGIVDTTDTPGNQESNVSQDQPQPLPSLLASDTRIPSNTEDKFLRLKRYFQLPPTPESSITTLGGDQDNIRKPTGIGGEAVYYLIGDTTLQTPWHVTESEKITVFVEGNLTFGGNHQTLTSVEPGGFLAFIVSGDIIIEPTLGDTTPADATDLTTLTGVLISDGTIHILSHSGDTPDHLLKIEGTLVGWSGITNSRSFKSTQNNTKPATIYQYRGDFALNPPSSFKTRYYTWNEVAP